MANEKTTTVAMTVTDEGGKAVAGASVKFIANGVQVSWQNYKTDSNGKITWSWPSEPPPGSNAPRADTGGAYRCFYSASKGDLEGGDGGNPVFLKKDQRHDIRVVLKPKGKTATKSTAKDRWRSDNVVAIHSDFPKAAKKYAGKQGIVREATSIAMLRAILRELEEAFLVDLMLFFTHGKPGALEFGKEQLYLIDLSNELEYKGFDSVFNPGAQIRFYGCGLADSVDGELFLVEFGRIMLKSRGGTVSGSTTKQVSFEGLLGEGKVYSLPGGSWVTAEVQPTGEVRLKNAKRLNVDRISGMIDRLESVCKNVLDAEPKSPETQRVVAKELLKDLSNARKHLKLSTSPKYDYDGIAAAHNLARYVFNEMKSKLFVVPDRLKDLPD